MGTIYYGGAASPIHIEDHVLAHLKIVIATKLRRGESFTLSWPHPEDQPAGRTTIWLHPSIPLRFEFSEPNPPELDPRRIQAYANSANSTGGVQLSAGDMMSCAGSSHTHEERHRNASREPAGERGPARRHEHDNRRHAHGDPRHHGPFRSRTSPA